MKLLTADETAHALGIERRTLQRWARRGYFPKPTYLGRRAYYAPAQVDEFINKQLAMRSNNEHSQRA